MCCKPYIPAFFLFFVITIDTHVLRASEYVPWQMGDSARYVDSFHNAFSVEVDQQRNSWLHYTDFAGLGPLWVLTNQNDEKIYIKTEEEDRRQLLVDFDQEVGTVTEVDILPCNTGLVKIASESDEIHVLAGSFSNVTRLDFEPNCADGGVLSAWFVQSVGVVKWTSSTIAGPVSSEMVRGVIQGMLLPAGVFVEAIFPEQHVTIDNELPVGPGVPPQTLNVSLSITNNTGRDLIYRFETGQRFEILLINSGGETVSYWSRGKIFIQEVSVLTLEDGNTWSFGGPVELSTNEGVIVPGGNYTLRIELTTTSDDETDHKPGAERISTTSPLTIETAL
ncbi:MAG: BsuPI-related putative proteinase inhibitor [Candidatus Brocadiaceae bacterium]|nr:BsuPI-related putative proteinase inhibitor [Candidatus Brocadiaceae bacterium]